MRTGYSILLGEFIDADLLSHRDCEPFQVVCPSCNEPLFKVERNDRKTATSYLSHYRQSKSFEAECERRAAAHTARERQHHNSISRDQKLTFFLSVFQNLLEKDPFIAYQLGFKATHKRLNRSKTWRHFRNRHLESARGSDMGNRQAFETYAASYVEDGFVNQQIPVTGFSSATQIRIAADMMRSLLTQQEKSSYEALFNHASIYLLSRFSTPDPTETEQDRAVSNNIARFLVLMIQSGAKDGMRVLDEMAQTRLSPPYVTKPGSYILKVASEISHEMVGTLLRLPYFTILKDQCRTQVTPKSPRSTRTQISQ